MTKRTALALCRLSVALLAAGVVVAQTVDGFLHPPFDYPNYFSFFSIQSNLLAAFVLGASAVRILRGERTDCLTFWRGAVTLYLTLAGTVYLVLLRGTGEFLQTPREQTNAVLHYLVPTALLTDWVLAPKERIPFGAGLVWLLYPLLYVLYSLGRGRWIHWYPYPFLDPSSSGYSGILAACLVMAAAMVAFIALLTWWSRRATGRTLKGSARSLRL